MDCQLLAAEFPPKPRHQTTLTIALYCDIARVHRYTLRGHRGVVYGCRFEPSGLRLASCSADGTVRLWDVLQVPGVVLLTAG